MDNMKVLLTAWFAVESLDPGDDAPDAFESKYLREHRSFCCLFTETDLLRFFLVVYNAYQFQSLKTSLAHVVCESYKMVLLEGVGLSPDLL